VLDGARPDFIPDDPWIRRWEGWVLGQTALPRTPPVHHIYCHGLGQDPGHDVTPRLP
jgi:hypothetical protein